MNQDIIWRRNLDCIPPNLEENLHTIPKTDLLNLVTQSMENLSGRQKTYLAKYLAGDSMVVIAREFGVNVSTVSRTISRAVKNMGSYLERVYIIRLREE